MRLFSAHFPASRKASLLTATVMMALIAGVDSRASKDIPLGFLYLFPMLLVGRVFGRWQIAGFAVVCTLLAEAFDDFAWGVNTGVPRDILYVAAFSCVGFSVYEATYRRKLSQKHMEELEAEMKARREAEEQLQILVDSSPAAIFTAGADGNILLANDAAHRLFAMHPGTLRGTQARDYLPSLINVPILTGNRQSFRTAMQCRGWRANGEVFQADVWFSTYLTGAGSRLAAMVLDTSEDLRIREEANLQQLRTGSRIMVAAVSHEIRNVCGAIALVHETLTRSGILRNNKDFEALGTLVLSLEAIAAMDLQQAASEAASTDIRSLLDELRIVTEGALLDNGIVTEWRIDDDVPPAWADRRSLMQVFLNLTKNSERAMRESSCKQLAVAASCEGSHIAIRFTDTGCGVAHPERLFRPFQAEAQSTGLGLYLSRAFMRSFRGDLRYEAEKRGSTFVVELSPVPAEDENGSDEHADSNFAGGRSRTLPREPQPAPSD